MGTQADYLEFVLDDTPSKRITKKWEVLVGSHASDTVLGVVKWYAQWRKYCFFPHAEWGVIAVFEQRCLREIAAFIEHETEKRRAEREGKKAQEQK